MNAGTLIAAAWPRHAAKHIERGTGCSRRTAWRIVSSGFVPERLRVPLLALIDEAIERKTAELRQAQAELKAIEYGEMVERATARRAASGEPAAVLAGHPGPASSVAVGDEQLDLIAAPGSDRP